MACMNVTVEKDIYSEKMDIVVMVSISINTITNKIDIGQTVVVIYLTNLLVAT